MFLVRVWAFHWVEGEVGLAAGPLWGGVEGSTPLLVPAHRTGAHRVFTAHRVLWALTCSLDMFFPAHSLGGSLSPRDRGISTYVLTPYVIGRWGFGLAMPSSPENPCA